MKFKDQHHTAKSGMSKQWIKYQPNRREMIELPIDKRKKMFNDKFSKINTSSAVHIWVKFKKYRPINIILKKKGQIFKDTRDKRYQNRRSPRKLASTSTNPRST